MSVALIVSAASLPSPDLRPRSQSLPLWLPLPSFVSVSAHPGPHPQPAPSLSLRLSLSRTHLLSPHCMQNTMLGELLILCAKRTILFESSTSIISISNFTTSHLLIFMNITF